MEDAPSDGSSRALAALAALVGSHPSRARAAESAVDSPPTAASVEYPCPHTPVRYSLKDLRNMAAARAATARRSEENAANGLFYSPARQRMSGIGEFRRSEYSARPLRWLDVGTLYEASAPNSFLPRHTPGSMAPTTPRARLPPLSTSTPRHQPIFEDDGSSAACPICLATFVPADDQQTIRSQQKLSSTIQWTSCCGRMFHERCLAPLSRCPMCRCDLGFGLVREMTRLSPPVQLKVALEDCAVRAEHLRAWELSTYEPGS